MERGQPVHPYAGWHYITRVNPMFPGRRQYLHADGNWHDTITTADGRMAGYYREREMAALVEAHRKTS